jgi:hypothetical protein
VRTYRVGMTVRKNGIVIDDDGAWTAACYLLSDPQFEGTQHGVHGQGTLCGLPEDAVAIVRNPFYGTRSGDCHECATRLQDLAR